MSYEYVFDAQPTVNGTNIKDILINDNYPDEVYCNGSHIAHLKKDVTVSSPRLCFTVISRRSEIYEDTDSCGYVTGYGRCYYVTLQHYERLTISRDPYSSSGKRISKINWKIYEYTGHSTSGTLEYPEYKTYDIPTVTNEYIVYNDTQYEEPPDEDWSLFSSWTFREKIKTRANIYYTDGTMVGVEDGHHSDKYTRVSNMPIIIGSSGNTTLNYTYTKQV
jgi:hypothetical protein